jgi:hypothetical protein
VSRVEAVKGADREDHGREGEEERGVGERDGWGEGPPPASSMGRMVCSKWAALKMASTLVAAWLCHLQPKTSCFPATKRNRIH